MDWPLSWLLLPLCGGGRFRGSRRRRRKGKKQPWHRPIEGSSWLRLLCVSGAHFKWYNRDSAVQKVALIRGRCTFRQ